MAVSGKALEGNPLGDQPVEQISNLEKVTEAIRTDLGGFAAFKEAITKAALGRFGSGWAWLSLDPRERLVVESTANKGRRRRAVIRR